LCSFNNKEKRSFFMQFVGTYKQKNTLFLLLLLMPCVESYKAHYASGTFDRIAMRARPDGQAVSLQQINPKEICCACAALNLGGVTGNTGATGPMGNTGATGSIGATGVTGSMGNTGATGSMGNAGATGLMGNTGATGSMGNTGTTGSVGNTGATGSIGATGATGPVGSSTGNTGATGNAGATGNTGPTGNPGEVTLSNAGISGVSLVYNGTGPDLVIKGLSGGTGITSVIDDGTTVVINTPNTTLASAGGTSLVNDGIGPDLAIKGLVAATGISFTNSATQISIASTNNTTLTSAGGDETLVNDGTGPTLALKGLTAVGGVSLTDNGTFVTISGAAGASNVGFFAEITTNAAFVADGTITGWSTATASGWNSGDFNTVTGIFSPSQSGIYYVSWQVSMSTSTTGAALLSNETVAPIGFSNAVTGTGNACAGGSMMILARSGRQYRLTVSENTTVYANINNVGPSNPGTWFSMILLVALA
jgi:hypothetical protein